MRFIIISILVLTVTGCSTYQPVSIISMENTQVVYRGFTSRFHYTPCPNCDTTYIQANGGNVRYVKHSQIDGLNAALFESDSVAKEVELALVHIKKKDTTISAIKRYPVLELPEPDIFYAGINLSSNKNIGQMVNPDSTEISARITEIPALQHVQFLVKSWSVTYNDKEVILNFSQSKLVPNIIKNLKVGETVQFNYALVFAPDNTVTKYYLKRQLRKVASLQGSGILLE